MMYRNLHASVSSLTSKSPHHCLLVEINLSLCWNYFWLLVFINMTEDTLHYDREPRGEVDDPGDSRSSEFRATPLRPTPKHAVNGNEAVMVAPSKKSECKSKSSKNSRKPQEIRFGRPNGKRMRASIKTRFSSFEEKMLGMMADFQRWQKSVQPTLAVTSTVCMTQHRTSGVCQPSVTRINTFGSRNGSSNVILLDNSLTDQFLGSRSPVERDLRDNDDILSL